MRNKYVLTLGLALLCSTFTFAQHMVVKQPNFSGFNKTIKSDSKLLLKNSSAQAQKHPEFDILPFNAQCSECVELIDKRTETTRYFIDPKNEKHYYSQSSYFPLHFKRSAVDAWHTIDKRLAPDPLHPGVYTAPNQPVPTKCDLVNKSTTLDLGSFQFECNKNLTMYFVDGDLAITKAQAADYTDFTVGEEGLHVRNVWPGIDMVQVFDNGEVETNYHISKPLDLPITKGYMVIEDHFTLPEGVTIKQATNLKDDKTDFYSGDYIIESADGNARVTYQKPVYLDARDWGMHGYYNLLQKGRDYTLQAMVPIDWLTNKDNIYPLTIDPTIFGQTKRGDFLTNPGASFFPFGFSTVPQHCDYQIPVSVQGGSVLTNALFDVEYKLTYDNTCGNPHLPSPYCTMSQVYMQVVSDACGVTSGPIGCSASAGSFIGVCTTDSNLVPGATKVNLTNLNPNFLSCIPFQCQDYFLNFTLKNSDSTCEELCQWLCAKGHIYQMTVEAQAQADTVLPVIYLVGDTLHAVAGRPIQWYKDGTVLPGQTDSLLIVLSNGTYQCIEQNIMGCYFLHSNSITITEVSAVPTSAISIYPNPAHDHLFIKGLGNDVTSIIIYDAQSKEVVFKEQGSEILINKLSKGVYIIEVNGPNYHYHNQFIKE